MGKAKRFNTYDSSVEQSRKQAEAFGQARQNFSSITSGFGMTAKGKTFDNNRSNVLSLQTGGQLGGPIGFTGEAHAITAGNVLDLALDSSSNTKQVRGLIFVSSSAATVLDEVIGKKFDGQMVILTGISGQSAITITHASGNAGQVLCPGDANFTLSDDESVILIDDVTAATQSWRLIATSISGDNLGDHLATQDLDLNGNALITSADGTSKIDATGNTIIATSASSEVFRYTSSLLRVAQTLEVRQTTTNALLELTRDDSTPNIGDDLGLINFLGDDDGGTETIFGQIKTDSKVIVDGSEDGRIAFKVMDNATLTTNMEIDNNLTKMMDKARVSLTAAPTTVTGARFELFGGTDGDGDIAGQVAFIGNDSGAVETTYGLINVDARDITNATEDGEMEFSVMVGGTLREFLSLHGQDGEIKIGTTGVTAIVPLGSTDIGKTGSTFGTLFIDDIDFDGGGDITDVDDIFFNTSGQSIASGATGFDFALPTGDDYDFDINTVLKMKVGVDDTQFATNIVLDAAHVIKSNDSTEIGIQVTNESITIGTEGTVQIPIIEAGGFSTTVGQLNGLFGNKDGCMGMEVDSDGAAGNSKFRLYVRAKRGATQFWMFVEASGRIS